MTQELFLNQTFRYTDGVLSLTDLKFGDYVDRVYLIELEIQDNTSAALFLSSVHNTS